MFELGRSLPIGRRGRPSIRPHQGFGHIFTDHGFNGEGMPRSHLPMRFVVTVVQNVWVSVKHGSNAVATKVADR